MWTAIELSATLIECIIITHFMTRFLGYKSEKHTVFKFLLCVALLTADEWFVGDYFFETAEIILLIVICFAYCFFILKVHFLIKYFAPLYLV